MLLRWLEVAGLARVSGRRRDERAAFVGQVPVAQWFGVAQPPVSRWQGYGLRADWPHLLRALRVELLRTEVRAGVGRVFAACPWGGLADGPGYLGPQGAVIS